MDTTTNQVISRSVFGWLGLLSRQIELPYHQTPRVHHCLHMRNSNSDLDYLSIFRCKHSHMPAAQCHVNVACNQWLEIWDVAIIYTGGTRICVTVQWMSVGCMTLSTTKSNLIVRRAGLLWSQQDFEWRWSVPLFKCLTVLEFSFILFDLCLLITFFNFIMNYVPIVTFWIFTYHRILILSIMFCFIWSYWIIYFLACLEVSWRVVS